VCTVLAWLRDVGDAASPPLAPHTAYYSGALSSLPINALLHDLVQLRNHGNDPSRFFLTRNAFLLSAKTKRALLGAEAAAMQAQAQQIAVARGILSRGVIEPFTVIRVRRDQLVPQTLQQVAAMDDEHLRKPLKVVFEGEDGVDEGGVRKEFFQIVIAQLFDVNYGMFLPDESDRIVWFNKDCTWCADEYRLIGVIVGLAAYNAALLDVHFPMVVYKRLMAKDVGLADLEEIDAQLYRGLRQLLDYDGDDVEEVFCRTFLVEWEDFGLKRTFELTPGGADIPVTSANRQEYVDMFVHWYLVDSVASQYREFAHGFARVMQGASVFLLRPEELKLLVVGEDVLDFHELDRAATYEGGYTRDTPAVGWFWEVVHAMDEEEQKRLLAFTTGSSRAPIGGLGNQPFIIQRAGPDSAMLPSSHTCFSSLLLPEYSSKAKLERLLKLALRESEGFGLA